MKKLEGLKVAILVENGFEQVELEKPRKALDDEGAHTEIVSPCNDKVKAWATDKWGDEFKVDKSLSGANPANYQALLLPGGVMNPGSALIKKPLLL
jgi:protease I